MWKKSIWKIEKQWSMYMTWYSDKKKEKTNHAESVTGFDVSGIGAEFQEAVSELGPVLGSNGERFLRSFW